MTEYTYNTTGFGSRSTGSGPTLYALGGDPTFEYDMDGGVQTSGFGGLESGYNYVESGGVVYVGSIGSVRAQSNFYIDFTSTWNTSTSLVLTFQTSWNIGPQRYYWYRVQSACSNNATSCETMFIVNILATSVQDVCTQLTRRNLNGRILSIAKFNRPALPADQAADLAIGINNTLNVPTDVTFCNVPACLDFCIDYDMVINPWTVPTTIYINAINTAGGFTIGGSAIAIGFAEAITMIGGVVLSGQSNISFDSYENGSTGGPEMGGTAFVTTENWSDLSNGGVMISGQALVTSSNFSYGGSP